MCKDPIDNSTLLTDDKYCLKNYIHKYNDNDYYLYLRTYKLVPIGTNSISRHNLNDVFTQQLALSH